MKSSSLFTVIAASAFALMLPSPATPAVQHKPRLPLEISIAPTRAEVAQASMRPGDVVELAVPVSAEMDVSDVRVDAKVQGGAELVSGSLKMSAKLAKGEQKQLVLSVRVPDQGRGSVMATATFLRDGKKVLKRSMRYFLGPAEKDAGSQPAYKMQKDSQGRKIIEY